MNMNMRSLHARMLAAFVCSWRAWVRSMYNAALWL